MTLRDLTPIQLMAFIFLLEQEQNPQDKNLKTDSHFLDCWRREKLRLEKLIENYPDIEEEKHFLIATLEAVYGVNPNDENSTTPFLPLIDILLASDSSPEVFSD